MKKTDFKKIFAVALSAVIAVTAFTGCAVKLPAGGDRVSENANGSAGKVLISVNPSIELEYDRNGKVIEIEGKNDDGREVVKGYTEYAGKDASAVAAELVKLICDGGFFEKTVDGHTRNVVIKLEDGSEYPNDGFLTEVADSVKLAVEEYGITSSALTVGKDDLDDKGLISYEKAKELAKKQMEVTDATFTERELELDDGVYELEFFSGGIEYEVEVDARTGKIREADIDGNDDWRDDDRSPAETAPSNGQKITAEQARELAFAHFGLKAENCSQVRLEYDDGHYEFEFKSGGKEYEVEINSSTGAVSEVDVDRDDVFDDLDDRYDDDWDDRYDDNDDRDD